MPALMTNKSGRPVRYTISAETGVEGVPIAAQVKVKFATDLPVDLLNELTDYCQSRRVTKTAVVEQALREFLISEQIDAADHRDDERGD